MIPATRIYLTGSQRLSLLTALTDLVQVEDGNTDLEEVLRKLGPPGQPDVIEGQTDIDDMLEQEHVRLNPDLVQASEADLRELAGHGGEAAAAKELDRRVRERRARTDSGRLEDAPERSRRIT